MVVIMVMKYWNFTSSQRWPARLMKTATADSDKLFWPEPTASDLTSNFVLQTGETDLKKFSATKWPVCCSISLSAAMQLSLWQKKMNHKRVMLQISSILQTIPNPKQYKPDKSVRINDLLVCPNMRNMTKNRMFSKSSPPSNFQKTKSDLILKCSHLHCLYYRD